MKTTIATTAFIVALLTAGEAMATCQYGGQWPDCKDKPPVVDPEPTPEPTPDPEPKPDSKPKKPTVSKPKPPKVVKKRPDNSRDNKWIAPDEIIVSVPRPKAVWIADKFGEGKGGWSRSLRCKQKVKVPTKKGVAKQKRELKAYCEKRAGVVK